MTRIINIKEIVIENSDSVIGFETTGDENHKLWDRYLTINSKKAYHIGNICGTCSFFFERLDGANRSISPDQVVSQLMSGMDKLDDELVDQISKIIPNGHYITSLIDINPKIITIGSDNDYFSNEQVKDWGIDGFWGFPHHPKIRYYRGETKELSDNRDFYEFFVPMFPQNWLKIETIEQYKKEICSGNKPTAISITILDIKEHYDAQKAHWCLTHYIIDGHHKLFASSEVNKPIRLLSFFAIDQGISSADDIMNLVREV